MADDLSNILHSNFGLRPSGKSAPMGAKKAVSPGSSGPGYSGGSKTGGQANTDPIQDDKWGNGAGSKGSGSFGNSYEAFGSTGGAPYNPGEDPFFSGPPSGNAQSFPADDMFGMGGTGSGSSRSAGGRLDDPFMSGPFGSSPTAPDPFGGLGGMSSMPRGSPLQQTSSGGFAADDDLLGGFGSTMPPRPSAPVSAADPFSAPAPPPVSSKSRGWGTSKESPDPSPRRTFFSSSKQSAAPAENKGWSPMPEPAVPAREEKYLTVGELLLHLSTPPSMSAPPSRPPPPPPGRGRPTPVSTPKASQPVRQEASRDPPPPSYTAATQPSSGWQTPTGSSRHQPRPEPTSAPENLDGFDDFAASRSRRGTDGKTPEAESTTPQDAEASAAAAAATNSAQQMADAMARAQEKAARAKAAREREDARRAREEAAERLRAQTQAKTQRPPDPPPAAAAAPPPGFDFFGGRAHSEPRQRPAHQAGAQPDFMSVPRPSGPTNLDDLGGMGTRKPPAPDVKKSPSANNVTDWTDVLGGAGVQVPSSNDFQEIDGEAPERRELRYQRYLEVQRRATEALAEKNRRDMEAQQDQVDRARAEDVVGHEIKRWAAGKENNIRALLSTLQFVLWPEAGWEPIGLTDLMSVAAVKKAYRKATLCVHPDKVQQKGATATQKYIAEKVFDLLKEAWNKCNQNELF